ncbi:MAG: hypothetical protein ACLFSL_03330 [Candidatus Woesearchaeota archaeon]
MVVTKKKSSSSSSKASGAKKKTVSKKKKEENPRKTSSASASTANKKAAGRASSKKTSTSGSSSVSSNRKTSNKSKARSSSARKTVSARSTSKKSATTGRPSSKAAPKRKSSKKSESSKSSSSGRSSPKASTAKKTQVSRRSPKSPGKKSSTQVKTKSQRSKRHKSHSTNDISDLEAGTSMHERLERLEHGPTATFDSPDSSMDKTLGLPPLPGYDEADKGSKKKGLFSKVFGDSKEDTKTKAKGDGTSDDKMTSPDESDEASGLSKQQGEPSHPGTDESLEQLDAEASDSLGPSELKEFKSMEKDVKDLEQEETAMADIPKAKSKRSSSGAPTPVEKAGSNSSGDMKTNTHPDSVPREFSKEEPHKREKPLKMESDIDNGTDVPEPSERKDLPAADNSYKLQGKKKKGLFAKLFGSKPKKSKKRKKGKDDKEKPDEEPDAVKKTEVDNRKGDEGSPSMHESEGIKEKAKDFLNKKDKRSSDDKKSDDSGIFKDEPGADENDDKSRQLGGNAVNGKGEGLADDAEVRPKEPTDLSQGDAQSSADQAQSIQDGERTEDNQDQSSNSFFDDAISAEMSHGQGADSRVVDPDAQDYGKEKKQEPATKDEKLAKQALSKEVSKLQVKKEKLEKELAEVEKQYKETKTSFEDKRAELEAKQKKLDKRQVELDERESILLTLQTDLIRERKELDNREFKLFMSKQSHEADESPAIDVPLRDDMKSLPQGLSDERMKIEQMMNQTRTLAINNDIDKAKSNYNRLVEKFHEAELSPNDRKVLHLSIKELYNDISLLVRSSSEEDESAMQ